MSEAFHLLMVEDSATDAKLVIHELRHMNRPIEFERVEDSAAMRAALARGSWDAIISDWSMPNFSGLAALALVTELGLDIPFLFVSGTVGEEVAVEALHNGACDFLSKDKLTRLTRAVERGVHEAQLRRERNEAREQLRVSDRMVSVGILAASVAHEINNPLAAVIANLHLAVADIAALLQQIGESSLAVGLRDELIDACAAADRLRVIVRDVKVFSRDEAEKRGPVDVRRVIESSLRMASNEIRHHATVVADFGDVPPVFASEGRLGQVFLNLIINAAQAIPEGSAGQNEIRVKTRVEGDRARIDIEDTGPGIPREILKRLFTPFVTTKPVGVGTGLGLSICRRIITEFGGEITVESQLGVGTVFVVRLPLARANVGTPELPRMTPLKARRGTVLVVDDDPLIATAIQRSLARDHDVTRIHRAREAIERIQRGERFDVIISDLMMPEMTGMELHAALLGIAPEQAAAMVFMSGGAFTTHAREFLEHVSNQRLEKPFDSVELRALINGLVR